MPWPFKWWRSHKNNASTAPTQLTFGKSPDVIPLENTENEDIINAIVERALVEATKHEPGAEFSVLMTDDEWIRCGHPVLIMGPVFIRAADLNLTPESAYNREFTFSVPFPTTPPLDVEL